MPEQSVSSISSRFAHVTIYLSLHYHISASIFFARYSLLSTLTCLTSIIKWISLPLVSGYLGSVNDPQFRCLMAYISSIWTIRNRCSVEGSHLAGDLDLELESDMPSTKNYRISLQHHQRTQIWLYICHAELRTTLYIVTFASVDAKALNMWPKLFETSDERL